MENPWLERARAHSQSTDSGFEYRGVYEIDNLLHKW